MVRTPRGNLIYKRVLSFVCRSQLLFCFRYRCEKFQGSEFGKILISPLLALTMLEAYYFLASRVLVTVLWESKIGGHVRASSHCAIPVNIINAVVTHIVIRLLTCAYNNSCSFYFPFTGRLPQCFLVWLLTVTRVAASSATLSGISSARFVVSPISSARL